MSVLPNITSMFESAPDDDALRDAERADAAEAWRKVNERKVEAYDVARSRVKIEGNTRAHYVLRIEALEAERDEAIRERDLAIAHDRQPYPTAAVYDAACAALDKHRRRADVLDNALHEAINLVGFLHGCLTDPQFKYAYPEHTTEALARWQKLASERPDPCVHGVTHPGCPSCEARIARFASTSSKEYDDSIDPVVEYEKMVAALWPYWEQQESMTAPEAITKLIAERAAKIEEIDEIYKRL